MHVSKFLPNPPATRTTNVRLLSDFIHISDISCVTCVFKSLAVFEFSFHPEHGSGKPTLQLQTPHKLSLYIYGRYIYPSFTIDTRRKPPLQIFVNVRKKSSIHCVCTRLKSTSFRTTVRVYTFEIAIGHVRRRPQDDDDRQTFNIPT